MESEPLLIISIVTIALIGVIVTILYQSSKAREKQERRARQLEDLLKESQLQVITLESKSREDATETLFLKERLKETKEASRIQQEEFISHFKEIAGEVVTENSNHLRSSNKEQMELILTPLKERISRFEDRIEKSNENQIEARAELRSELKKLQSLNMQLGKEAEGLTRALKGDSKFQGNWGELVLERILEKSGLAKGVTYEREVVSTNANGETIRPDVIIRLPDNKHLIIDSKVSLTAYENFSNSETKEDEEMAIKRHLLSIRQHIKGLGDKYYQTATTLNSPDFVLLFLPIESSFSLALKQDEELFNFAWERNIVIVCPTTLLATLKTVESIWRQENQTKNAEAIARESGALYDKFVAFLEDMDRVGKGIDSLQKHHNSAMNKLSTGRGNLIRRAEGIKKMGAKVSKEIPSHLNREDGIDSPLE